MIAGSGVAVGALALAASPLLRGILDSLAGMFRPAVGVVAPPSARYPELLARLESGVRAGLAAGGQGDAPVFARAAADSAPSSVAAAARLLVEREHVDLLLCYANPTQVGLLGDLAAKTGVPVVVVDPGAHVVTSKAADARVLSHSLGYWQAAWKLGASAAGARGGVYVISSRYESGFDILSAFGHGLEHAGGSLAGTSLTHVREGDVAAAATAAADSRAGAVFVAASGHEAEDVLRAIAADSRASRMPLLLGGLAVGALAAAPSLAARTALTWPAARTSAFEMLGADVGRLVAAAVDVGRKALPKGRSTFAGVRGDITFDLATGRTDVPVRIHTASVSGGRVVLSPAGAASNTSEASAFADAVVPDPRTGWIDVYGGAM